MIRGPLDEGATGRKIPLRVDRHTLAKRRWRGVAEDGREFGFDLETPLRNGADFFRDGNATYAIAQETEAVLRISLARLNPEEAARRGWMLGNLHFPVQVARGALTVADDPAIRPVLEREGVDYEEEREVFTPLHGHAH